MPTPRKSASAHWLNNTRSQASAPEGSPLAAGRARYPKNFSQREKSIFKDLARQLEDRGHATAGDAALLELVARVWARWQRALEHLAAEGEVVEVTTYGKDGQPLTRLKPNCWLGVAHQSEREILKTLMQLGLTPAMRDKIKSTAPKSPQAMSDDEAYEAWLREPQNQQGAQNAAN